MQLIGNDKGEIHPENQSQNQDGSHRSAHVAGKFCFVSSSGSNWIVDSDATDHMCHDLSLFTSYDLIQGKDNYITIPNGTRVSITYSGTMKINQAITLQDVLYVPDFKFKLIFIPKICKDMNCNVVFTNDDCYLQSSSMNQQILRSYKGGLYYLDPVVVDESLDQHALTTCTGTFPDHNTNISKAKLWHLRMGHLPVHMLNHIPDLFTKASCTINSICQICPLARQTRNSFPSSSSTTLKKFQLIHVDTWGPYKDMTYNGCK